MGFFLSEDPHLAFAPKGLPRDGADRAAPPILAQLEMGRWRRGLRGTRSGVSWASLPVKFASDFDIWNLRKLPSTWQVLNHEAGRQRHERLPLQ